MLQTKICRHVYLITTWGSKRKESFIHNFWMFERLKIENFFTVKFSKVVRRGRRALVEIYLLFWRKMKPKLLLTYPFDFMALFQSVPVPSQALVSGDALCLKPHALHLIQVLHGRRPFLRRKRPQIKKASNTREPKTPFSLLQQCLWGLRRQYVAVTNYILNTSMCFRKAPTNLNLYALFTQLSWDSQQPTQKRLQVTEAKF